MQRPFSSTWKNEFKTKYSFDQRLNSCKKLKAKCPDRIAVIVQRAPGNVLSIPDIERQRFLVPLDTTVGKFITELRKHIRLQAHQAIFLFVNNSVIPACAMPMNELYDRYKDVDGFLYITYSGETTFG